MANRRATAVVFGFDFQVNAAIVLSLSAITFLDATNSASLSLTLFFRSSNYYVINLDSIFSNF